MGRQEPVLPERKAEFESEEEWGEFIIQNCFADLVPGQPFLLIARCIHRDTTGHSFPPEQIWTKYYLGELASDVPIAAPKGDTKGFAYCVTVNAARYCQFPSRHVPLSLERTETGEGLIEFNFLEYYYTSVRKAFIPPLDLFLPSKWERLKAEGMKAFELAVGFEAIETLRAQETERVPDFTKWFVRSAQQLGFPLISPRAQETLSNEKQTVIASLLAGRECIIDLQARIRRVMGNVGNVVSNGASLTIITDEVAGKLMTSHERDEIKRVRAAMQDLLTLGRKLGMADDNEWIQVGGLSYQPARILKDFEALFPAS